MNNNINVVVGGPINADYPKVYKTKFLKPGIPFSLQVTEPNTKYVIKHDFVLDGNVTIPANCVLEFDGGDIGNNNHSLSLADDTIVINVKGSVCTTVNRPTLVSVGYQSFDITLGKPIWFDGENWVDATGTPV